jgi:hypothetical protein
LGEFLDNINQTQNKKNKKLWLTQLKIKLKYAEKVIQPISKCKKIIKPTQNQKLKFVKKCIFCIFEFDFELVKSLFLHFKIG